jgi:hypothetical protein
MNNQTFYDQVLEAHGLSGGAKIHGNYCGPSWTAGMPVPAKDVEASGPPGSNTFTSVKPTDNLDLACAEHDWFCGHISKNKMCTPNMDQMLITKALNIAKDPSQPYGLRAKSLIVATGMYYAKEFMHKQNAHLDGGGMIGDFMEGIDEEMFKRFVSFVGSRLSDFFRNKRQEHYRDMQRNTGRRTRGGRRGGVRGSFSQVGDDYKLGDIFRWILDMERPEKIYRRNRSISQETSDWRSGRDEHIDKKRDITFWNYDYPGNM